MENATRVECLIVSKASSTRHFECKFRKNVHPWHAELCDSLNLPREKAYKLARAPRVSYDRKIHDLKVPEWIQREAVAMNYVPDFEDMAALEQRDNMLILEEIARNVELEKTTEGTYASNILYS